MADRDCHHGQLARVCDLCEKDAEIAALRAQLEQAQAELTELHYRTANYRLSGTQSYIEALEATITRQRAWIESAGHRPGCGARETCRTCGSPRTIYCGFSHAFQPGPCDCGYAELVGG